MVLHTNLHTNSKHAPKNLPNMEMEGFVMQNNQQLPTKTPVELKDIPIVKSECVELGAGREHRITCCRWELNTKNFVAGPGGAVGLEGACRPQGRRRAVPNAEFAGRALQWARSV